MFEDLFSKSGLSMERLHSFCLIVKHASITQAAERDPNRQSQFSRQLKDLETFFGTPLLERTAQPYTLTDAGQKLYEMTMNHFSDLENLMQDCKDAPVNVAIGAGEAMIQWLLIPKVGQLRQRLPNVRLRFNNLRSDAIVAKVQEGELDLGLVRESAVPPGLESCEVGSFRYVFCIPHKCQAKASEKISIEEVGNLPLALIGGGGEFRTRLDKLAASAGVRLPVDLECTSYTQVAHAVSQLGLCGFLPEFALEHLGKTKLHQCQVIGNTDRRRKLALTWSSRRAAVKQSIEGVVQQWAK